MSGIHQTWTDPSYPECPMCEEETINDAGWCPNCQEYASEMERHFAEVDARQRLNTEPFAELKRTGTGGWFA